MRHVLATFLFLGGIFLFFAPPFSSEAQQNAAPIVSGVTIALTSGMSAPAESSIITNESADKTIFIHGSYSDDNGCTDVATSGTVRMTFYRSWVDNGPTCTENRAYCFRSTSVGYTSNINFGSSCTGGADTTGDFEFSVPVPFYVDPTDTGEFEAQNWIASVTAVDNALAEGTNTATTEIATLSSMDMTSSVNFGNVALDTSHASESFVLTVTNTGNNNTLDLGVHGTPMNCTRGTIPVGNVGYVTTTFTSLISAYTPVATSTVSANVNILKGTVGTPSSQMNVYWDLIVPVRGVGGTCAGTLTLTAQP